MTENLFHSGGQNKVAMGIIYFIENAEMRYGWRFIAFKKPQEGTGRGLYHWKC